MTTRQTSLASPVPFCTSNIELYQLFDHKNSIKYLLWFSLRTYISIAGDLEMFTRNRCRQFMGVKKTCGGFMVQSDQISIAHQLDGIGAVPFGSRFVEFLNKPTIVAIFVAVSGYLLLFGTHSFRIQMQMGMQISSTDNIVSQRQQSSIPHIWTIWNTLVEPKYTGTTAKTVLPFGVLALLRKLPSMLTWNSELKNPSPGPLNLKTERCT